MSKILWIDNDSAYIDFYARALVELGNQVLVAANTTDAELALGSDSYDLVILDVMIPTKSELEEEIYDPEDTDHGHKTGLVFYRRHRERMNCTGTKVLVMTVRLDRLIREEFVNAGLPRACFRTKMDLREIDVFTEAVAGLLA